VCLLTGCGLVSYERDSRVVVPCGTCQQSNVVVFEHEQFRGISVLMNDSLKNLAVGKETKATRTSLSIGELHGDVDAESIKAISEGVTDAALKRFVPIPTRLLP
jgi:hypothetical protein